MDAIESLFEAIRAGDLAVVAARLDAEPALASARDANGLPAVMAAAYHGRRDVVALLLERGAALRPHEAAAVGDVDRLRAALDADPGAIARFSADGWTALHLAAFFGHADAVRLLLERGASPVAVSTNALANHPLHAALAGPTLGVDGVALLLDAGADVNARQHGGYTALHAAAMHGDAAMLRLLLERGADPSVPADDGKTAEAFAREKGHAAVADALAHAGAPIIT
ncbi:MAG: Ankyrin [Gemmatimonadetes bacterium]|nr:Ankyrin [Gemmatimonadota bacterium]